MTDIRYVAIGDSFTEGVGDELSDGTVRGWADLVAQGWAYDTDAPRKFAQPCAQVRPALRGWADLVAQGWANLRGASVSYANLAIRGKLVWPIVEEQLEVALALKPTHLSFNGGGNDILRPRTTVTHIVGAFSRVLQRCDESGVQLILLSGANPSAGLPLRGLIQRRGDELSDAVIARIEDRPDVVRALNWPDAELAGPGYWSEDRLHMNSRGHHRVAARVLEALGETPDATWWSLPALDAQRLSSAAYYRAHVGPWVRRRLAGRSSGDGRAPKFGTFTEVTPAS